MPSPIVEELGLKLHPCLTPRPCGKKFVCLLPILTPHLLFVFIDFIMSYVLPPTPLSIHLYSSPSCQIRFYELHRDDFWRAVPSFSVEYFCIVLVTLHSEGLGSGFPGLYVFGWTGFSISFRFLRSSNHLSLFIFFNFLFEIFRFDREAERSNILLRFSTAKFKPSLLQWNVLSRKLSKRDWICCCLIVFW